MNLYQMVLKDIFRRKKRILYAALGVVIGTMTVVGILTTAVAGEAKIVAQLEKYGPNLSIIPAISNLDMKLGDLNLGTVTVGENYIQEDKIPEIRRVTDRKIREYLDKDIIGAFGISNDGPIATIAPKLYVPADIKGASVMLVGIEPAGEQVIRTWWQVKSGEYLKEGREMLAGASAAALLRLNIGDKVTYNNTDFTVTGVLDETGSGEDYELFVPLAPLQAAAGKEGIISSIDIRALCKACPVEIIADSLNQSIPGIRAVAVKKVALTEMGMLDRINKLMFALAGITLLIGCFGVANTMMTSVHERVKDIGIMRAVGASFNQIIKVFLEEAIIIGVIGGIVGYVGGSLLAYAIGPLIYDGASVSFVLQYLPVSLILSIMVAVAATAYPAFQATRIRVADSFRSL
jgi:putative ABC transport system permease protein